MLAAVFWLRSQDTLTLAMAVGFADHCLSVGEIVVVVSGHALPDRLRKFVDEVRKDRELPIQVSHEEV
ncbi:MAG: hypothetical protein M0027_12590 [Candidatus Dormibacteraeota bacterium]|jgi:hypothetical protein|nr:hypothetical protein [Candidatus Dormibacteraeota bacterium]